MSQNSVGWTDSTGQYGSRDISWGYGHPRALLGCKSKVANSHVWQLVLAVDGSLAKPTHWRLPFSSIWVSPCSCLGFLKIWCLGSKNECSKRKEIETASLRSGFEIHFWHILSVRARGQPRFKGREKNSTSWMACWSSLETTTAGE